jgi:endonuclease YncB( thermonuclease family)
MTNPSSRNENSTQIPVGPELRTLRNKVVGGRFGLGRTTLRAANKRRRFLPFVWVWTGAALLGTAYGAGWLDGVNGKVEAAQTGERTSFRYCFTGGGYDCVVDGDTIWLKGVKIRIADIDAPETHDPRCASEKALGDRATVRLHDLLESGSISLKPIDRDEDIYRRKLRIVLVNGESVGDTLVAEGLARYYGNGRRPWC